MSINPEAIYLRTQDFYDAVNIKVLTAKQATGVDVKGQVVKFQDGDEISFDKLVIATGKFHSSVIASGKFLKCLFT